MCLICGDKFIVRSYESYHIPTVQILHIMIPK